jgi:integrase/recombinase XerD
LIDAADSLAHRTMLMVLYSTGMRSAELLQLQVSDIDSRRMLIHIQQGKGGRDRYVPLSPVLLATLRMYYLWMQPKTWMFQGTVAGCRADELGACAYPTTGNVVPTRTEPVIARAARSCRQQC